MRPVWGVVIAAAWAGAGPAPAAAQMRSLYTDLTETACRPASAARDAPVRCPGVGGYRLAPLFGDDRVSIDVIAPNGTSHPLDYWTVVTSAFTSMGTKAEWRVRPGPHGPVPTALIVRVIVADPEARKTGPASYLAVAKILPAQACVVARIPAGGGDNATARTVADRAATMACLQP